MRKNTKQKNSKYGHFSQSELQSDISQVLRVFKQTWSHATQKIQETPPSNIFQNMQNTRPTEHRTFVSRLPHQLQALYKKMKFSIKEFLSKSDQIRSFLTIWSHLLKKSLMKNFVFCAVKPICPGGWIPSGRQWILFKKAGHTCSLMRSRHLP